MEASHIYSDPNHQMMAGNDVNDKVYFLNEGSTVLESDSAWVGTG